MRRGDCGVRLAGRPGFAARLFEVAVVDDERHVPPDLVEDRTPGLPACIVERNLAVANVREFDCRFAQMRGNPIHGELAGDRAFAVDDVAGQASRRRGADRRHCCQEGSVVQPPHQLDAGPVGPIERLGGVAPQLELEPDAAALRREPNDAKVVVIVLEREDRNAGLGAVRASTGSDAIEIAARNRASGGDLEAQGSLICSGAFAAVT